MTKFDTLYKRDSKGKLQQWTIIADGNGYYVEEGHVGGKITKSGLHTCEPKNPGKKNATTAEQQAIKEAKADWDKKLKHGYCKDVNEVDNVTFKKPMKGDKWKDRADEVTYPVDMQDKLNGIRLQSEADRSYSTGGETFWTIPHIRLALAPIYEKWPKAFIDGEGFNYALRKKLNRLVELLSVNIKQKDLTPELLAESEQIVQLHVFDGYGFEGIKKEDPYRVRKAAVAKLIAELNSPYIYMVKSWSAEDLNGVIKGLAANKRKGGEGFMIRWGDCPFKHGRSKYMLKLKHFEDAEYKVVAVQEGNGDWKGCAKRIILALPEPCKDADGNIMETFAANIEGDREWLRKLYQEKIIVIGEPATVEYQQLSEYGIPQLPWVRAIRNYE